jgi:hypothetical protein
LVLLYARDSAAGEQVFAEQGTILVEELRQAGYDVAWIREIDRAMQRCRARETRHSLWVPRRVPWMTFLRKIKRQRAKGEKTERIGSGKTENWGNGEVEKETP